MSQIARPRIDCSVGLGGAGKRAHNRVGLESGISGNCGNGPDVGDAGSRARNPALERNHWGQRVSVEGKADERRRSCVGDEAAGPSPDKTEPTQDAARRATAIPTTPLEVVRSSNGKPQSRSALQPHRGPWQSETRRVLKENSGENSRDNPWKTKGACGSRPVRPCVYQPTRIV